MTPSTTPPSKPEPTDPDLAEQARPGHGIPSQDPDSSAQFVLNPGETAGETESVFNPGETPREAESVLVGGAMLGGAASGAGIGALVGGPVGVLVGASVGAMV